MNYTQEQFQQCREEVNRLRRELNSTSHPTHEMHERYNAALKKLKEMKDEYAWDQGIGREFASAEADIKAPDFAHTYQFFTGEIQEMNYKLYEGIESQHFFFAVTELKGDDGKLSTCLPHYRKPILYRWWFPQNVALKLLVRHKVDDLLDSTLSTEIGGNRYYALYFGKGNNGRTRFTNHIHKHKRFSTLRRTIGGLLCTADEDEISKILDKCYYEWSEISCQQCKLEDLERKAINKVFYPLNLKDNNRINDEWRKKLEELRKKIS